MEEKAKRVGRFNIVDIIAVILMIAVAAFVGWKLLGPDDSIGAERAMTKVTFVVKVEGVPAELYENCVNHLPSPLMASGALVGGEIVAVEQEPYYVLSAGGEWIEDEEHTTLLFTAVTQTPTAEVIFPPMISVGIPRLRASSAKGPSRKQTNWAVMVWFKFCSKLSTWVLAPPESPPLMRWMTFMESSRLYQKCKELRTAEVRCGERKRLALQNRKK